MQLNMVSIFPFGVHNIFPVSMQDEEQGHGSRSSFDCFLGSRISNQCKNSSESTTRKHIASKNEQNLKV